MISYYSMSDPCKKEDYRRLHRAKNAPHRDRRRFGTTRPRYPCRLRSILYYTMLYYTILYYTILYDAILYYTILYYTILS